MAPTGSAAILPPGLWRDLLARSVDERAEPGLLMRLLDLLAESRGVESAAFYVAQAGGYRLEVVKGDGPFPRRLEKAEAPGLAVVELAGGLLVSPGSSAARSDDEDDPLLVLAALSLRACQLRHELKEQHFQVSYRGVELEALYDVGLAIASTLDLERVSEEILLRAVSLLDARRGALYLLDDGRYLRDRTFGGAARESFVAVEEVPEDVLPGVRHLLSVPVEIEGQPRGLLVVGDKESRRGVGPFEPGDRRTLSLFANQAAIALENARLHREGLEKERLEREMELAAEIQRRILPKCAPEVPGFELYGWSRPARQVGGDYYDLLPLGGGRFRLALGDVSGKGMPAALLVSTLHSALRLLGAAVELGPELLARLNAHLVESSASNKFVTLFVSELDAARGELAYINAGHNPALLLRAAGGTEQLGAGGLPVGLLGHASYRLERARLAAGDLLCIYSDGITEAESPAEEEFGAGRLAARLADLRQLELPELAATIDAEVSAFAAGQPPHDDATLVLLRRTSA